MKERIFGGKFARLKYGFSDLTIYQEELKFAIKFLFDLVPNTDDIIKFSHLALYSYKRCNSAVNNIALGITKIFNHIQLYQFLLLYIAGSYAFAHKHSVTIKRINTNSIEFIIIDNESFVPHEAFSTISKFVIDMDDVTTITNNNRAIAIGLIFITYTIFGWHDKVSMCCQTVRFNGQYLQWQLDPNFQQSLSQFNQNYDIFEHNNSSFFE
jgi:hypothetical protein